MLDQSSILLFMRTAGRGRCSTGRIIPLFHQRRLDVEHESSSRICDGVSIGHLNMFFGTLIMRPNTTYLSEDSLSAASSTGIAHRSKTQSNGSRTSCPFRLSPLLMKSEHITRSYGTARMRLPETRTQITQEGHSIRLHDKRLRNRAKTVKAWRQAFLLAPFLVLAG